MGLLDRALRGSTAAERPVLAEGAVASPTAGIVPAIEALEDAENLRTLLSDLSREPEKADSLLAAFCILARHPSVETLALYVPDRDRLRLAASKGFPPGSARTVAAAAAASCLDGASGSDRARLSELLGLAIPRPALRGIFIHSRLDSPFGLWVFGALSRASGGSNQSGAEVETLLSRKGPLFSFVEVDRVPLPSFSRAIGADAHAVALTFELGTAIETILSWRPGLEPSALASVVAGTSQALLGTHGKASRVSDSKIALALSASTPLDPELVLFQFRKSLLRSLSLFDDATLPAGSAIAFSPAGAGGMDELGRFIVG